MYVSCLHFRQIYTNKPNFQQMNRSSHFVFRYKEKEAHSHTTLFWKELCSIQPARKFLCKRNNVQTLKTQISAVSLSLRSQNVLNVMNVLHWKRFSKLCDDGKANGVRAINSLLHAHIVQPDYMVRVNYAITNNFVCVSLSHKTDWLRRRQ